MNFSQSETEFPHRSVCHLNKKSEVPGHSIPQQHPGSAPPAFPAAPPIATVTSNFRVFSRESPFMDKGAVPKAFSPKSTPAPATCAPGPPAHARTRSQTVGFVPAVPLRIQTLGARPRRDTTAQTPCGWGRLGARRRRGECEAAQARTALVRRRPSALPWRNGDRPSGWR